MANANTCDSCGHRRHSHEACTARLNLFAPSVGSTLCDCPADKDDEEV